ncbi:MAG: transglutaminase-like domain-containing protein [Lentisphaerota bacterium]
MVAMEGPVAIFNEPFPGADPKFAEALAAELRKAGMGVSFLTAEQMADGNILNRENYFLLVLPYSKVFPVHAQKAFLAYLKQGGNVLCFEGPPFEVPVWRMAGVNGDQWMAQSEVEECFSRHADRDTLFGFEDGVRGWIRNANAGQSIMASEAPGVGGTGLCMRVDIDNLQGWDCYQTEFPSPPPQENDGICFWAKGDEKTTQLAVEGMETDQSRWYAVAGLEKAWKFYMLPSSNFVYWSASPVKGRGGAKDRFNLQKASKLQFGVAFDHTKQVGEGPHTYWIDEIGTMPDPYKKKESGMELDLEAFAPLYKYYPLKSLAGSLVESNQTFVNPSLELSVPGQAWSCVNRPRAVGYQAAVKSRWIPLIYAIDPNGEKRGTLAYLYLNSQGDFKGALWGVFSIPKEEFLSHPAALSAFAGIAKRLREGVYILKGGSWDFSCYPDQTSVKLGMSVGNFSREDKKLTVRILVLPQSSSVPVFEEEKRITLAADGSDVFETIWEVGKFTFDEYTVRVELLQDGRLVDVLAQPLGILPWTPDAHKDYVTVKDGDFWLKGEKWYPVGVNYWPLYVAGMETSNYAAHWLSPGQYDPELIEPDLKQLEDWGVTAISIQAFKTNQVSNTLDFLRRCKKHDLYANVYIEGDARLIEQGRYDLNDTLFAYDVAWETVWGTYDGCYGSWHGGRVNREKEWKEWVVEKYGGVENAEKDWGYTVSEGERFPAPSDRQLDEEGNWVKYVAAYRRFVDDFTCRQYWDINRKIKAVDPHHLVSFRMNTAGDVWCPASQFPYDFRGLAKAVDFFGPEGYSFSYSGDRERVRGGLFTATYARYADPGKPIVWTEFGLSVWSGSAFEENPRLAEKQGLLWSDMFQMIRDSGANGGLGWWYPGGCRVDENNSDYGIVLPDHTPRPAGKALAACTPALTKPREIPQPTTWFIIDRDLYCGGFKGLFDHLKDDYFAAVKAGHVPGFKTEGTGTDSVHTPLTAVGNTDYNGSNPAKYLNAMFMQVKIKTVDGWQEAEKGKSYRVKAGEPVMASMVIGNTGEAGWVCPSNAGGEPGGVYLVSSARSEITVRAAIEKDVPYLGDAMVAEFVLSEKSPEGTSRVELEMLADGRCRFGERFWFTMVEEAPDVRSEEQTMLNYYQAQSRWTDPGDRKAMYDAVSNDVPAIVEAVQGVLIHGGLLWLYQLTPSEAQNDGALIRKTDELLRRIAALDAAALGVQRPVEKRLVVNCRQFAVLTCSILRAKGIPARARAGYALYTWGRGKYENHWICEYWKSDEKRWVRVDAQLDAPQKKLMGIDFDPLDIPAEKFVSAGVGWMKFRDGQAKADDFGLGGREGWKAMGWGMVMPNVTCDMMAMSKVELLPWNTHPY